ncbi:MAG: hypothetical protein LBG90_03380 [Spirochaetaceae bacterium]|jgi:NCS2 family nucleobase:cation symporter-2|nr:hypothetical protein [Spirochaetaceae bacterium]
MSDPKALTVSGRDLIYRLEGRPPLGVAFPLGLQHVLSMFVGNLAPVLILAGISTADGPLMTPEQKAMMVQCCMFASGLTTMLQLYPIRIGKKDNPTIQIGAGLPIVMGTAFAFVPTLRTMGTQYSINIIIGSIMAASIVEAVMGLLIKPLKKVFPSLVIGAVLLTIGLHLLPVGVQYFAGGAGPEAAAKTAAALIAEGKPVPEGTARLAAQFGSWQNLLIGSVVFLIIVCLQRFAKGMLKISAILIAIIAGYLLATALGQVDFTRVKEAGPINVPIPLFIKPEFNLSAIISLAAIYVVSGLETMGNVNGITIAGFDREATIPETQGAVIADAAGSIIASTFNTLPNTAFGQNAGIVAMTKVVNKFCIFCGAIVLIIASFFPKLGELFAVMPTSVLGGAVVTVFAMIMLNGIKLIAKAGFTDRNLLILAITFGVGFAISENKPLVARLPGILRGIFNDTTVAVGVVCLLLNLIFPASAEEKAKAQEAH